MVISNRDNNRVHSATTVAEPPPGLALGDIVGGILILLLVVGVGTLVDCTDDTDTTTALLEDTPLPCVTGTLLDTTLAG